MTVIISLLEPGGYRFSVAASSAGWSIDHADLGVVTSGCSVSGVEVKASPPSAVACCKSF